MSKTILVKNLDDYLDSNFHLIGNKAKNILDLKNAGFRVPQTWIIEANIPELILNQAGIHCDHVNLEDFKRSESYLMNEIPNEIKRELWYEVSRVINNCNHTSLVVRSSSTLEDSDVFSFAGIFTTVVNVKKIMSIVDAIISIWSSSFNEAVYELCTRNQIDSVRPCAVILQSMVNSKVGGVTFKDQEHIVINSSFGLTKAVVDGLTEPDQWVYKKSGYELIREVRGMKEFGIYPIYSRTNPLEGENFCIQLDQKNYNGETVKLDEKEEDYLLTKVKLPEEMRQTSTLTNECIESLLYGFEEAGKKLGFDTYDIEWCLNQNDELFFLQIRSATRNIEFRNDEIGSALPLVNGYVSGKVEYVANIADAKKFQVGSILLAKRINGAVLHASAKAVGCIVESCSVLSHSAIIARELNIPCIGVKSTELIEKDCFYEINGTKGEYTKVFSVQNDETLKINEELQSLMEWKRNISGPFFEDLLHIPDEWK
ncbi:PEP/pyruvate-binding domain-containing protein [Paenibacillus tengchongensis]|uniref:PEP/pyruvate-binding domain-containing protein n=1 Tax=Paenibacillus tengchongensis TaxID=2608684 RepID=UPI00124CCEA6|nr:PEP/pyruvate-binding domain-containing protein [Paenibacillus tengchongensis]